MKNNEFYETFKANTLNGSKFLSEEYYSVDDFPNLPIYFPKITNNEENRKEFLNFIRTMDRFIDVWDKEIYMNGNFWHSLLISKRDYFLGLYPKINVDQKEFENIITKKFDWENYIYKSIMIALYVNEQIEPDQRDYYYNLALNNLDVTNYILKSGIFKNSKFFINMLKIIDEEKLQEDFKAKIYIPNVKLDLRCGRKVIYELNKAYPILLCPMMEKEELKIHVLKYYNKYKKYIDREQKDNEHSEE